MAYSTTSPLPTHCWCLHLPPPGPVETFARQHQQHRHRMNSIFRHSEWMSLFIACISAPYRHTVQYVCLFIWVEMQYGLNRSMSFIVTIYIKSFKTIKTNSRLVLPSSTLVQSQDVLDISQPGRLRTIWNAGHYGPTGGDLTAPFIHNVLMEYAQ